LLRHQTIFAKLIRCSEEKFREKPMKTELKNDLLIELTPQEAATIKGGRHGADDPAGDDRGGRGKDDGPGHA
jgi:hypothetical protein